MPNALLARYFHAHELFGDLDFTRMKEAQPNELFKAWLTLSDMPITLQESLKLEHPAVDTLQQ